MWLVPIEVGRTDRDPFDTFCYSQFKTVRRLRRHMTDLSMCNTHGITHNSNKVKRNMISTKSDVSVMNAGTLVDGELLVADENLMSDK